MKRQINIIPNDYSDNYRDALGYPWQDYATKTPGEDIRGEFKVYQQTILDLEAKGIICTDPKNFAKIPEGAEIVVRVDCMWCGGASMIGYHLPADTDNGPIATPHNENPGEELEETAAIVAMQDAIHQAATDDLYRSNPGYCKKCHSFCYGDCESNP